MCGQFCSHTAYAFAILIYKMVKKPTITVMPETQRRFGKKKIFLIAGGVVVAAVLIGGVWMWWSGRPVDEVTKKPETLSTGQINQVVDKSIASGNYDDALETLKDQPQSVEKQLAVAIVYMNKKDYKSALAIYNDLDRQDKLPLGYISGAASFAELAKDEALALHYYKEAKEKTLAQKDAIPTWKDDVARYDAAIKRLQK